MTSKKKSWRYFTAQEVIAVSGVTYRRLDYWVRTGLIRPSGRAAVSRGSPRLFTFRDIVEIRVVVRLTAQGLRLSALRKSLRSVRRRLDSPLATERLVTDGQHVFRYLGREDAIETLDEFGQFAFSFAVGDEIDQLASDLEKLSVPSRYRRRAVAG